MMIASERKKYILGKLNANGIVNVRETAQEQRGTHYDTEAVFKF